MHVLVADDELNIVALIEKHLTRSGYTVETARNGVEALAKIQENMPNILVSDGLMPEMDGFELLSFIRRDSLLCHLPVVLLTGRCPDTNVLTSYGSGTDWYLTKPLDLKELIRVVNHYAIKKTGQVE